MSGLDKEDIQIFSAYYSVEDNLEKADVPVTDEEMKQLSSEEINDLFGNVYYGEKNDMPKKKEKSNEAGVLDKFLTAVGIKPVNAYAQVLDDEDVPGETYLKKLMIVYSKKVNGVECYEVIYFLTWETMPKYRNVNVVSLYWVNATWQPELDYKTKVKQNWDYCFGIPEIEVVRGCDSEEFSYYGNPADLKKSQFFVSENGIVAAMKLHDNRDEEEYIKKAGYPSGMSGLIAYQNEELVIQLYLEKDKYRDTVIFYPYYQHLKSSLNVRSIAVGIIGAAIDYANKNKLGVIYKLVSGYKITDEIDFSGKTVDWSYTYKYK